MTVVAVSGHGVHMSYYIFMLKVIWIQAQDLVVKATNPPIAPSLSYFRTFIVLFVSWNIYC